MSYTAAIRIIQKYKDDYIGEPQASWSKQEFELCAHALWAANEIIERFIEEATLLPPHISGNLPKTDIEIIQEFITDMDYYAELSKNRRNRLIFSIARDTGRDILCLFL